MPRPDHLVAPPLCCFGLHCPPTMPALTTRGRREPPSFFPTARLIPASVALSSWRKGLFFKPLIGGRIFDRGCICSLYPKTYFKIWKNSEQKFCAYISTFYVHTTRFCGKPIFLALCVTKTKTCCVSILILTLNFVFLPSTHEKVVFLWNNLVHV
jgi:hypothetical protein